MTMCRPIDRRSTRVEVKRSSSLLEPTFGWPVWVDFTVNCCWRPFSRGRARFAVLSVPRCTAFRGESRSVAGLLGTCCSDGSGNAVVFNTVHESRLGTTTWPGFRAWVVGTGSSGFQLVCDTECSLVCSRARCSRLRWYCSRLPRGAVRGTLQSNYPVPAFFGFRGGGSGSQKRPSGYQPTLLIPRTSNHLSFACLLALRSRLDRGKGDIHPGVLLLAHTFSFSINGGAMARRVHTLRG